MMLGYCDQIDSVRFVPVVVSVTETNKKMLSQLSIITGVTESIENKSGERGTLRIGPFSSDRIASKLTTPDA